MGLDMDPPNSDESYSDSDDSDESYSDEPPSFKFVRLGRLRLETQPEAPSHSRCQASLEAPRLGGLEAPRHRGAAAACARAGPLLAEEKDLRALARVKRFAGPATTRAP